MPFELNKPKHDIFLNGAVFNCDLEGWENWESISYEHVIGSKLLDNSPIGELSDIDRVLYGDERSD